MSAEYGKSEPEKEAEKAAQRQCVDVRFLFYPAARLINEASSRARAALWETFQSSVNEASSSPKPSPASSKPKMIKVEKVFKFAGQVVKYVD